MTELQGIDVDLREIEEPTEEEIEKEDKAVFDPIEEVERIDEMTLDAHPLS